MKLEDVNAFLKVAEFGSFSRAAYSLCLSKSVVSTRVARLERELEARLFARTTRGVSLTELGEIFKIRSQRALEQLEAAQDALRDPGEELTGSLRFSTSLDFGIKCVAKILPKFLDQHPGLKCTAEYTYDEPDLKLGHFDMALRLCRPTDYLPNVQVVARVQNLIVGSPELVDRVGAPIQPTDLRTKPCVTYHGIIDVNTWHFEMGNRAIGVTVKGGLRANNMEALRIAAEGGAGFAQMPVFSVWDSLRAGTLVRVLPDHPLSDLLICADYPPGANVSRATRQFVDFLTTHLSTPTTLE